MASGRIAIGVDVGGSGIKAAVVDVEAGRLRSERIRVATPDAVDAGRGHRVDRPARQAARQVERPRRRDAGRHRAARRDHRRRRSRRPPTSTRPGSTSRSSSGWAACSSARSRSSTTPTPPGSPRCASGSGADQPGVVIFLTLGTGVGSGVFNDGVLVPNTEFGQMEIRGRAAERRSAAAARVKRGLSWKAWAADLDEHLDRIEQLMWPNLMILGGGVSKSADRFIPRLTVALPGRAGRACATTPGSSGRRSSRPRRRCRPAASRDRRRALRRPSLEPAALDCGGPDGAGRRPADATV